MYSPRFRFIAVAAVMIGIAWSVAPALAQTKEFSAPLVPCGFFDGPYCGGDPLTSGAAAIFDNGEVTVTLTGAAPNTQYLIDFAAPDLSEFAVFGFVTTNSAGVANFDGTAIPADFSSMEKVVESGNVVVINMGNTAEAGKFEFYSGVKIQQFVNSPVPEFMPYNAPLVRCIDVQLPFMVSNCGSDPLSKGWVEVNSYGDLKVVLLSAIKKNGYSVEFRTPDGTTIPVPGKIVTDLAGDGVLKVPAFLSHGPEVGIFAVVRNGANQFFTGFEAQKSKPQAALSDLVRCASVGNPVLRNCGIDPLHSGVVNIGPKGEVTVRLTGVQPSTTYTVVFRPLDNSGDLPVGTLPESNDKGDVAETKFSFLKGGPVYSGAFVIQNANLDEFVPAFK
jgi:hypothetical protein